MLRELDQNQQQQRGVKVNVPPPMQQDFNAQSYQQQAVRKIPNYRVERYINAQNVDKENEQINNFKFYQQSDIPQKHPQQYQPTLPQQFNQSKQNNNIQQKSFQDNLQYQQSQCSRDQFINSASSKQDANNDSLNCGKKKIQINIINSLSNEKLNQKSQTDQPYQVQSAEVKSCKFSNRPNSQDWLQFGTQQRYDVNIQSNENKKIVRNLNFTDSFNISQILKESTNNNQNEKKQSHPQLNASFQSNSSLCRSKTFQVENIPEMWQQQQQNQIPNQLQNSNCSKKRSQSLSTQNSQQSLNIPQANQFQLQQCQNQLQQQSFQNLQQQQTQKPQQNYNNFQSNKQMNISQENIQNYQKTYQKPPTNIQSHNIHQSTLINSNSKHQMPEQPYCQQINQEDNQTGQNHKEQMISSQNLEQSTMYKSVISQINEDFISKDSMNLLLHEEEFLSQFRIKIEQEKNSMRQSYDFIMKHLHEQISMQMSKQFSAMDKQITYFTDLFTKFKSNAIEYKNISSQIPPLCSNLKNMWNSCILNNITNQIQDGSNKQLSNNNNQQEIIDWEGCIKNKAQQQQQHHTYQQVYFQQKELLLQTECLSQQIYQHLQINRSTQIKDQSLQLFFSIVDQMKPTTPITKKPPNNQMNQTHHLLDNKKQQCHNQEQKTTSLERNAAVINTEFSPEKMGFKYNQNKQINDSQQFSGYQSQTNIQNNALMKQSEINSKITKLEAEKWDNNLIFTQIQSRKPSIDDSNLLSAVYKENFSNPKGFTNIEDEFNGTLPLDKLVQLQRVQLLKYSESNFQEHLLSNPLAKDNNLEKEGEDNQSNRSLKIIAEDFVERIDSYKAPYMFRDEDQILESSQNINSNYRDDNLKSQSESNRSVQSQNEKNNRKKLKKMNQKNGKHSSLSNNGGASNMNQLFTDRDQEFQFDDQQDQFNNTYSIQLSVSRISNQDVDQLNETINNLRLLNDSFQNNNLNETLMNIQMMNTHNNSINNNNNNNNRLSLKQLLAQTNMQLAQQLSLNQQNNYPSFKPCSIPPPPPPPKLYDNKLKHFQNETEKDNNNNNNNNNLKTRQEQTIFSETDLIQLREQLKRTNSIDSIQMKEEEKMKGDCAVINPQSFQRKMGRSRINMLGNLPSVQSNNNIDEQQINETEREESNKSSFCQQANQVSQSNNNTSSSSSSEYGNIHQHQPIQQRSQDKQQSYNSKNHNQSNRLNSHFENPPFQSIQNANKINEYSSLDIPRKGTFNPQEYDSSRSNQSNTVKETQNSSICGNSDGQSHMSILSSKRRFESSLSRHNIPPVAAQSSYNIEFQGYVKQKQNPNDSFSRSSFRLNSQQSVRDKGNQILSPSCRNSLTHKFEGEESENVLSDLDPVCSNSYQYIKREMKMLEIFKPKTYQLFEGDNRSGKEDELQSKAGQIISCLWVRDNLFAFGTSNHTLIIYDTSKSDSENNSEKSSSVKIFSSKVPINKMVRVSDSIIALSSCTSKNIKLFDVDKLEVSLQLIGHNENITEMTFIQPSILISCSQDGCMILWQDFIITHKKQNMNQIKLMQTMNDLSRLICIDSANQILVYSLMFNHNRSRVSEIRIEKIIKTSSQISSINAQYSSNNILACGTDEGIVRIYDIQNENVIKIIKVSLTPIKNLLLVEHPLQNNNQINYILIAAIDSDDDLVTFSKISNSNDIISTNSKYRVSNTLSSNNLSTFFIQNPTKNNLQLFTLDQQTSQFSLWNLRCQ